MAILYPQGESKCGTTRKNTQRYFSPKRLISYLLFNCFVFYALFHKAGKAKHTVKQFLTSLAQCSRWIGS